MNSQKTLKERNINMIDLIHSLDCILYIKLQIANTSFVDKSDADDIELSIIETLTSDEYQIRVEEEAFMIFKLRIT